MLKDSVECLSDEVKYTYDNPQEVAVKFVMGVATATLFYPFLLASTPAIYGLVFENYKLSLFSIVIVSAYIRDSDNVVDTTSSAYSFAKNLAYTHSIRWLKSLADVDLEVWGKAF